MDKIQKLNDSMKTKEKNVTDNTNKIKIENMVLKEENNKNKNEIFNLKRQKEENELEKINILMKLMIYKMKSTI